METRILLFLPLKGFLNRQIQTSYQRRIIVRWLCVRDSLEHKSQKPSRIVKLVLKSLELSFIKFRFVLEAESKLR